MANIEELRNLADPLKGYQFKVTISNAPGTGAAIDLLQFRCTAAALPGRTIDQIVTSLDGFDVSDAGRIPGPRTWTTTFTEGTDVQVIERVDSWQKLIYDPVTGVQASRADYKRTATIELYGNDKSVTLTRTLVGIWPTDMGEIAFDKASSEAVTLDVTWAFDYMD
ncbi:MAG: hypothetical protein HKO92_06530 [Flavobacteriaceae bacterium]|nr:hypothetical protein [Flavobacteriaceae bacterium]